jgi:hypothetical protein
MSSDALPAEWVDQLFKRLSVRYGRSFMARWEGVEIADVKADWAQVLAGFRARPDCIAYGLDNLPPDRPPTATQFRDLCRAKPETTQAPRLDWKRGPIPADVAKALDRIKEPADVEAQYAGPKGWAYRMRDREAQGGVMTPYVRRLWRDAIGA